MPSKEECKKKVSAVNGQSDFVQVLYMCEYSICFWNKKVWLDEDLNGWFWKKKMVEKEK